MLQYVAIGLLAITALIVLINVIKGLIRGLKKTIGTLAAIIISAVAAAIVTFILCKPDSSLIAEIWTMLEGLIGQESLGDVLAIEEIKEAIGYYISMLAAPFVFVALYAVLSIIISIIVGIVVRFIPPHKKPGVAVNKLGGVGVGLVCGILVTMLMLMPVVGVLGIASSVGGETSAEGEKTENELVGALGDLSDDGIVSFYISSCGWMFDSLASADFDGERVYLKDDIAVILSMADHVGALSGDIAQMGENEIKSLEGLVDDLGASALLRHTLAGFISSMAENWLSGETFMGMSKIDAGELLDPVIDKMLGVIATSDKSTITADMTTLVDILGIMQRNGMLANSGDYDKTLEILGEGDIISELIIAANKNERMSGLADEITQLSIRALASAIGIPENDDDRYNKLMADIAETLNNSFSMSDAAKVDYVEENVSDALNTYGVEVSGEAALNIAQSLVADFGDKSSVNENDVMEFFAVYAIATSSSDMYYYNGARFDTLSSSDDVGGIKINDDGTISKDGYVFKNYNSGNYRDSSAYAMAQSGVDIGAAAGLYSAEVMGKTWEELGIINLDDILFGHSAGEVATGIKKYSECEDKDAAAQDAAAMIKEALSMADCDFDNMEQSEMLDKMSSLLDKMKDAEIYENATPDVLKAIFQSSAVKDTLKLSISEMNDFTNKLNANAKDKSYSAVTKTISTTVDMMNTINDKDASKEQKRENTQKLMNDMTPENAELLSTMATPSMMKDYVSDDKKAETVSNSVSGLFGNMADFKTNNPNATDEEYQKEADAVNTVLNLAVDGTESDKTSLFNTTPGDATGRVDATADEYVALIVESDVVSKTVQDTLDDHPEDNPFGVHPSEEDEAQLNDALVNYYNNNADPAGNNDELIGRLNAVAAFTNITPPEFN